MGDGGKPRKTWADRWEAQGRRVDTVTAIAIVVAISVLFFYVVAGSRPLDTTYMFETWCALTKPFGFVENENAASRFFANASGNFTLTEQRPVIPSNFTVEWTDGTSPFVTLVPGRDYAFVDFPTGTIEILNASVSADLALGGRGNWFGVTYIHRLPQEATMACNGAFWSLFESARLSLLATVVSFAAGLPLGLLTGWARTLKTEPFAKLRARLSLPDEPMSSRQRARFRLVGAGLLLAAGLKRFAHRVADGYVEVMRGTPLFVQILFVWSLFLVKTQGIANFALIAGILAMTANTGGYQGEIFRGGLQTVHSGQLEAARAIGLTRLGAMQHIVLPQALRLVIPPLTNEFIGLFKASSLLFFIGIHELTFTYKALANFESRIFEVFALVTLLYLLVTIPVSKFVEHVERRYRIPGLGIQAAQRTARKPAM